MIRSSAPLRLCEIKIIDILIILIAVGLTVLTAYSAYIKPSGKSQILIQGQNSEWIYNLESEETVKVNGPIGHTIVRISDGVAWVESSPCSNQNCVAMGIVRRNGQWTACLPNEVLVIVQGSGEDNEVDAVTQ